MNLLIVDTKNVAYAAYHALRKQLTASPDRAILFGFIKTLLAYLSRYAPYTVVLLVFDPEKYDNGVDTWRAQLYPEYKKNRVTFKDEKDRQEKTAARTAVNVALQQLRIAAQFLPVIHAERANTEADDVIAWLVHSYGTNSRCILSNDEDFAQLITPSVSIYNHRSNIIINAANYSLSNKYGLATPDSILLAKAILGDKSDNISKVDAIGEMSIGPLLNAAAAAATRGGYNAANALHFLLNDTKEIVVASGLSRAKSIIASLQNTASRYIIRRNITLIDLGPNSVAMQRMRESREPWVFQFGSYNHEWAMAWFNQMQFASLMPAFEKFIHLASALRDFAT